MEEWKPGLRALYPEFGDHLPQPFEIITLENFQETLKEIEEPSEPRGQKRKHNPPDVDDEVVVYEDQKGGLVRPKDSSKAAGLRALQREFGKNLPQPFIRPAYKWVSSLRINFRAPTLL